MMVLNLQSISKGCFWLPLKWLFSPRLPLPHALCWGPISRHGSHPLALAMQGLEGEHPITPLPMGGLGMEPLLIEVAPSHLGPSIVFTLLQPQLGPLELVSIREKQCP